MNKYNSNIHIYILIYMTGIFVSLNDTGHEKPSTQWSLENFTYNVFGKP